MVETLPFNLPLPRLLAELGATRDGLSGEDVERRLAKYGPNDALAIAAGRCGVNFLIASLIL
jgi:Cation transporter/ATPase, N-terminus